MASSAEPGDVDRRQEQAGQALHFGGGDAAGCLRREGGDAGGEAHGRRAAIHRPDRDTPLRAGHRGHRDQGCGAAIGGDAAPGAIQLLPFQAERQRVGRLRAGQDQAAIRRGGQGQAVHAAMFQRLAAAGFHGARGAGLGQGEAQGDGAGLRAVLTILGILAVGGGGIGFLLRPVGCLLGGFVGLAMIAVVATGGCRAAQW
jgi:hypothetical protein